MDQNSRIERTISIFLFSGLFLNLFYIYFAQERLYSAVLTGSYALGSEKYLRILSIICIFLSVILAIFTAKNKYKISIYFSYLILIFYITLNYIVSGASLLNMTHFMDKKGIGTWICLGIIFVSYNSKRYDFFKKFLIFSAVYISLLTIYNLIDFGIGGWRGQALSKYRVYAVNYVWIAPYVFLMLKTYPNLKWLRIYIILIGIILALVIQTRSFLIIYFFTLLFDFFNTQKKSGYVILSGVFGLALTYLVINTEILSTSLELLMNRGDKDTRTEQLVIFISQLDIFQLITGSGTFATYSFGSVHDYGAVDNQWLFLIWWGGLIPVLCYAFLCGVIPVRMIFKRNLSYETKVECFVLILWFLALLGLAIFTTMSVDFFFFTISIILGRVLYKYSTNLT